MESDLHLKLCITSPEFHQSNINYLIKQLHLLILLVFIAYSFIYFM
jgi:hypothetical protein